MLPYSKLYTMINFVEFTGDRVRITKKKGIFDKGFTPNWRDEIFIISKIKTISPPTYIIRDERGEELGGTFYEPELQKSKTEFDVYGVYDCIWWIYSKKKMRGNRVKF